MSETTEQIIIGDANDAPPSSTCGCHGTGGPLAPAVIGNRPGLERLAYRVGTHDTFKESLLAALSADSRPALAALRTREERDFTIALIDAWAAAGDVLTFYQERIANEQFLRSATERFSIVEMTRLIGYKLRPGVAASAYLAITLEGARAEQSPASTPTKVPRGTRVQSVPGPNETAATFETLGDFEARVEWNALKARATRRVVPVEHDTHTYLGGIATGLRPGDAILLVGDERVGNAVDNHWDFRRLSAVIPDTKRGVTRIEWARGLGSFVPHMLPAKNPQLYALRLRASLFGVNAPHPRTLHSTVLDNYGVEEFQQGVKTNDWAFALAAQSVELDAAYPSIAEDSWLVLSRPTYQELYRVTEVTEVATARYATTGKRTRVSFDTPTNLSAFGGSEYRHTAAFTQSEQLELADTPIEEPVWGADLELDVLIEPLPPERPIIVRGKRPRMRMRVPNLTFGPDPGQGAARTVARDEEFQLLAAPVAVAGQPAVMRWRVRAHDNLIGTVDARKQDWRQVAVLASDEFIAELAQVRTATITVDRTNTLLNLQRTLQNAYDRTSTEILANVALASHGESVGEILGAGDAGRSYQQFDLRQKPLTYVSSSVPGGAQSTLELRINDVLWREVPSLIEARANDRVYVTRTADDGTTTVQFGNGVAGQRLPSGQNNVRARYRKGIGVEGTVRANQLTTPLAVPLGVRGVTNPLPAEGGADPEAMSKARRNAPITVTALQRVVSLQDYEDFALNFAGVEKARATWLWNGRTRRIFLTVAGAGGAVIPADGAVLTNLVDELRDSGDPFAVFEVASFRPAFFQLQLKVKVDPDHLQPVVFAAVETRLREEFGFERRTFGQPVYLSEVLTAVQGVTGVIAADVDALWRTTPPSNAQVVNPRLPAALPTLTADGRVLAAELLLLAPGPLAGLEAMT